MPLELEDRLERAADALPAPTSESRARARNGALAALAETRRGRRRRVVLLVPVAAAVLAVAVFAVLAAPWRDSPLATERALAALGHQPVIHAIVEQPSPRQTVTNLTSGRERMEEVPRAEYWYDDERDLLRVRLSVGGKLLPGGEYLQSPEGFFTDRTVDRRQTKPPRLDPALERFASGYREALDSGEATVVGEEVVDGREAVILRFSLPSGPSGEQLSEDVAVDAEDYRPLRFRFSSAADPGRTVPWSEAPRIVEIETIPRDPRDFEAPGPGEPRPAGQTGVGERKLSPAEAADALGRPVFWPGRAVGGVALAQIELIRLTTPWTDGRVTKGHALVFQYGADRRTAHLEGKPSLIITEGTSAEENPRFDLGGPALQPGELRLSGVGRTASGDPEMWFGSMQRDGVYISLESPQRDLILAAAKAMVPLD
jgi:hypothetical protein